MTVEDLPHFIECDDCGLRHFLTINRDSMGTWSAGYIAFDNGEESIMGPLWLNSAETLAEVALRMHQKLQRFNHGRDHEDAQTH